MKKLLCFLIAFIPGVQVAAQEVIPPRSELEIVSFISDAKGPLSALINPAGLAISVGDDGALLNYGFKDSTKSDERNFLFSMGNLAFGAQQFSLKPDWPDSYLRTYRFSLSVGGKTVSIGTTNKLIELQESDQKKYEYSLDVGIIFQPITHFSVSAVAKDLNKPSLDSLLQIQREYTVGVAFRGFDERIRLLGQIYFNDQTISIENAWYKIGMMISSSASVGVLIGWYKTPLQQNQFFVGLNLPLAVGISFSLSGRLDQKGNFEYYTASMLIPLQTVSF